MMKTIFIIIGIISFISFLPASTNALSVFIDEYIYQDSHLFDESVLLGTADFDYDGSILTITLTNTSTASTGDDGATNILTGIGFNLPEGMSIFGGSVEIAPSSDTINFPAVIPGWDGKDLSNEWGYDNDPITSGPFQDPAIISSTVDTVVSSMGSTSDFKFLSGSLLNPPVLDGPEMGLLSGNVSDSTAGGLYAVQDAVIISLQLLGSYTGLVTLEEFIDVGDVVLSFGSPNAPVPEPGTILLLGTGLIGLVGFKMRKMKRKR